MDSEQLAGLVPRIEGAQQPSVHPLLCDAAKPLQRDLVEGLIIMFEVFAKLI